MWSRSARRGTINVNVSVRGTETAQGVVVCLRSITSSAFVGEWPLDGAGMARGPGVSEIWSGAARLYKYKISDGTGWDVISLT